MVPELSYINNYVEAYTFGKSLLNTIKAKDPEKIRIQEKEFLADYFQLPQERIFFLDQVHGFDCIKITEYDISKNTGVLYSKVDAAFTQLENVLLCVRTADCLPLFFHSHPQKKEILVGIMHCGWRGLFRGIIQNTLQMAAHTLEQKIFEYKIQKKDYEEIIGYPITIFPGVYIPEKIYEVGKEVADLFLYTRKLEQNGKYSLDLWKNSESILYSLKISSKFNIMDPFHYLYYEDQLKIFENFFSHRRGDVYRNLNVIYIKKNTI